MAIDYEILEQRGLTQNRLEKFFTAEMPSDEARQKMTEEEIEDIEKDVEGRKRIERVISSRLQEHIIYSLQNHHHFSAVDIAWDSMPINKQILPLMMYAQGRIDNERAVETLQNLPDSATYIKKNADGNQVIDLPKFFEVNVNLLRSVITRRVAAQTVKYNNLFPFLSFNPRANTQVGRLKGDLLSQRAEVMTDQFGYRSINDDMIRDMLLYSHSVAFAVSPWERDVQWADSGNKKDGKVVPKDVIVREGVQFAVPHPNRVFYDNRYPIKTLNEDNGCEYVGFWDVARWGDIKHSPEYFNKEQVAYSFDTAAWFTQYADYFNQYYSSLAVPKVPADKNTNDRQNNVGVYSGEDEETAVYFSHLWMKIIPSAIGLADYPYPVWLMLRVAGDGTVVYAKIVPSTPSYVYSFNEASNRLVNISMAHELMPLQDQMTNLFSQLLETAKADLFSVAILNTDIFPDTEEGNKVKEQFERTMQGKNFYATTQVLSASFSKLQEAGIAATPDNVFHVVRSAPNTAINELLESIAAVISLADKLMVLSPQEMGQVAQHEISATEASQVSGSTAAIYNYISDAIDAGRQGKKRIIYESIIACDSNNLQLPVSARYSDEVIKQAGFEAARPNGDSDGSTSAGDVVIRGDTFGLVHDYTFTSRDGSERSSNQQAAGTLVQLLQSLGSFHPAAQQEVLSAMGKTKLFEIVNHIFRLADTGVDLKLEVPPGEDDTLGVGQQEEIMQGLQQLAEMVKSNTESIQAMQGGAPPQPPQ